MQVNVTPSQWSALQRGETVEILERIEPRLLESHPSHPEWTDQEWRVAPHAIGDKIAVRCPRCGGDGGFQEGTGYPSSEGGEAWRYEPCVTCYELGSIGTTIHSITARQVDGEWFWVLSVKKEEANGE